MIVFAPNSIWILLFALLAAGGMWRLYRSGHPHLRKPFVWLLPLLRAVAVFLVIITLTEPTLRRSVEEQRLSRLRFVVDESASMSVTDENLPVDQKVEIALAHGWLNELEIDLTGIRKIAALRETLRNSTRADASLERARNATTLLADADVDDISAEARSLLREDWVPSVARRRQIQVNGFARRLEQIETKLRADFARNFDGKIPDFDEQSRLQRVRHLLETVDELKTDHEVTIESLDLTGPLTDLTAITPPGANPAQAETIILLSDGRHHGKSDPGDTAALWADAGAQLFTIAFGDTKPRTDLILAETRQPRRITPGDLISGALVIYDSMPAGQTLKVEITDQDTTEVLWTDEIETSGEGSRVLSFAFRVAAENRNLPSLLNLAARVHEVTGEASTDNNAMPMPVFLSPPPRSSMLVIDGRPRWDSRYLRNIFRRDPAWTTDANFSPRETALPDEKSLKSHDLIVLGEVPATVVPAQTLATLETHVREGAGLLLIDGPREELRTLLKDHPLSPVTWFDAPQWLDRPLLALTTEGALEPALTLAPNKADNEAIWSYLPAPHRALRVRPKAGATILAEARSETGNTPLLVTQMLGKGRVLYISSDESWRWRYQKGDEYHTRYWQQLARWVMAEPFLIHTDEAEFDLDRLRIRQGEKATIRARFPELRDFEAVVKRDNQEILRTNGTIEDLDPGQYEVSLAGIENTTIPLTVIEPTSMEETVTHANPLLLAKMAERGNGEFLGEQDFPKLISLLASKRAVITTTDSTPIWQSFGWMSVIVLLVAIELFLRKRARLL